MSGSCKHQKRCGLLLLRLLYIFLNKIYQKKKKKKKNPLRRRRLVLGRSVESRTPLEEFFNLLKNLCLLTVYVHIFQI